MKREKLVRPMGLLGVFALFVLVLALSACDNLTGSNGGDDSDGGTSVPVPSPPGTVTNGNQVHPRAMESAIGITGMVTDFIFTTEAPPEGVIVGDEGYDPETGGTVSIMFTDYTPLDPPEDYPNLTINDPLQVEVFFGSNKDTLSIVGELNLLDGVVVTYAYEKIEFVEAAWTFEPGGLLDDEGDAIPTAATGTLSVWEDAGGEPTDTFQMADILQVYLASNVTQGFIGELLIPTAMEFDNTENSVPAPGVYIEWVDRSNGVFAINFDTMNPEPGVDITGRVEVTYRLNAAPYRIAFDGAITVSNFFFEYVGLDDMLLDWGSSQPDGPPSSGNGFLVVDTARYPTDYILGVIATIPDDADEE